MSKRIPKYRADVAGKVKENMADCIALMAGEIRNADSFMFEAADCTLAMREYEDTLTDAELATCFKRAMKKG